VFVTHCRIYRHLCRCFPTMVAVDYSRPLETVIPGTAGKVLGVLARTHAELPIRRVAQLGGVSRDRASIEIRRLVGLGVVSRREVAGASLVKLERTNAAALALLALADARSTAISRLSELAKSIKPAPASLVVFGSFARGTDDAESDLDVLVVRSDDAEPDDPSWLDSFGNWQDLARVVVGNPVNVIETSRHELGALARTRSLWRTIVDDAITLAGEEPSHIVAPVGDRATIVSQAVENSSPLQLSGRKPEVHTAKAIARPATAHVVRAKASRRAAAVPNARTAAMPVARKATASTPKRTRRAR
jgi:predicted nucleotidyltransferase